MNRYPKPLDEGFAQRVDEGAATGGSPLQNRDENIWKLNGL